MTFLTSPDLIFVVLQNYDRLRLTDWSLWTKSCLDKSCLDRFFYFGGTNLDNLKSCDYNNCLIASSKVQGRFRGMPRSNDKPQTLLSPDWLTYDQWRNKECWIPDTLVIPYQRWESNFGIQCISTFLLADQWESKENKLQRFHTIHDPTEQSYWQQTTSFLKKKKNPFQRRSVNYVGLVSRSQHKLLLLHVYMYSVWTWTFCLFDFAEDPAWIKLSGIFTDLKSCSRVLIFSLQKLP